jgi:ketosteroid isomerase-like protein
MMQWCLRACRDAKHFKLGEVYMKALLATLGVAACLCLLAFGHSNAATSPTANAKSEDDVRKLEQAWLDAAAVPDLAALRKMLDDDFMGTSFGVGVLNKTDVIPPDGSTENHMPKCVLKESTVRLYGDTAVLMGIVEMQVPQTPERIRMTTVFRKRREGWQVIAVHMSKGVG